MVFGAFIHNTTLVENKDAALVGKIVRWDKEYDNFIDKFKQGSHFKVTELNGNKYTLIACSKKGKHFKRTFNCRPEFLYAHIDNKSLSVL